MSSRNNKWISRFAKRSAVVLAAASASAGLVDSAFAQSNGTYTFNGDGAWSNTARWVDGFVPDGTDADSSFGSQTTGVGVSSTTLFVTLDSNRTVGSMSFSDADTGTPAGWVIQGSNTLRLNQSTAFAGVPTITVNGLGNSTVSPGHLGQRIAQITAPLSGTEGFLKTGGGTLVVGGNSTGLSGTVIMDQGPLMLGHANAIGTASTLLLRNGNLGLRTDTGATFGISLLNLRNDAVIGVGNSISAANDASNGAFGTGFNQTQTIGTITVTGLGHRGLTISGSNGYGLTMGTLNILNGLTLRNQGDDNAITNTATGDDPTRHSNNVNGLGSGLVTIDRVRYTGASDGVLDLTGTGALAGNITLTNGITETSSGKVTLNVSSDKTVTIGGTLGHTGSTAIRGNGATIVSTDNLDNGQALTITGGTLQFNGSNLSHSVGNLNMGAGTIAAGNVTAYLNLGSGGSISTVGSINVSTSQLTDGTFTNTIATINGKLSDGAGNKTINVQGTGDSLTVTGEVSGTGGIIKQGKGALNLTAANTFSGTTLTITDGVVAGTAQSGAGTPFGNTSVNVTGGGAIRLNGIGSAETESVSSYSASDTGQGSGIIVDASATGNTTLSIGSWGGRLSGERATVLVVGGAGSLGTSEHVVFGAGPTATNGMLDAYWAVQNSNADTQLSFANVSGGEISTAAYSADHNIDNVTSTTVYQADGSANQTLSADRNAFAVAVNATQALVATGRTLSVGTGGFGGVILNGGAAITGGSLSAASGGELNIWSGGTATNTISAQVLLGGDLTTGGATALDMQGTVDFGGGTRRITTAGNAPTIISGRLSNGNLEKHGGGTLIIGGTNTGYSGSILVDNGILQIGGSPVGDVGSAAITNDAILMFHRTDAVTMANAISGSGDLVQDPGTTAGVLTLSGNLTYTGKTIARTGTLRPLFEGGGQTKFFPSTSNLVIERNGTFDLNGMQETFATLNGSGTLLNSNNIDGTGGAPVTLTISSGSFGGSIRGTSANINRIALNKVSSGELILGGNNSSFSGTIRVAAGSLRVDSLSGVSSGTGNPTITLVDGTTLKLNLGPNQILANQLVVAAGNTATISLATARSGESPSAFAQIATGVGTLTGAGTVALDIAGRVFQFGPESGAFVDTGEIRNFSGTLKFLDTNPVGSKWRIRASNGTGTATAGSAFATFAFGNGNLTVDPSGAFVATDMGFVSGGTNTILKGQEGVGFRTNQYQIGYIPGLQTFAGQIQDWNERDVFTVTHFLKVGASSTLTLLNTASFTGLAAVSVGTLNLGPGANINGTSTVSVGTGGLATLAFGGGTFSTLQNFINLTSASGAVNTNGVVGYSTKPLLTYLGQGTIYGGVNHNAGAVNPGVIGTAGTMTFANQLTISQNGNFTFDVNPGVGTNIVIGGGTHDLLRVTATNGLRIDGGVIRLNFIGGTQSLSVGQVFPILTYAGTIQGGGIGAIQAFATFPGSFTVFQGSGSLANVLEASVVNLNVPTVNLTWAPPTADKSWDAVTVRNFKPTGGVGSQFFFNGDTLLFDDTVDPAHHTVILGASALQPIAVTVDTNSTYQWIGAGSFTGNGSLVKNGSGTLLMSNTNGNSFGGGVTVNGGFLIADRLPSQTGNYNAWGSGTITLNNDAVLGFTAPLPNNTQTVNYGGLIVNGNNKILVPANAGNQDWISGGNGPGGTGNMFGTGTLSMIRAVGDTGANYTININMISFLGTIKYPDNAITGNMRWNNGGANVMVGGPSVTFDLGAGTTNITMRNTGSFFMGQLIGGANSSVNLNGASTVTFGQKGLDSTFGGAFTGNNANGAFVKAGSSSTLTLTNTHGYAAPTLINEGTLALVNSGSSPIPFSNITVAQGATLDVAGLNSGGGGITIAPNQTLRSNGSVVGGVVAVGSGGIAGGTTYGAGSAIDVQAGGTLAPGNSIGTLTVGSLSLTNGSNLLMEVGNGGVDSIVVTEVDGLDLLDAPINVTLANIGGVVSGSYVFIDYDVFADDPTEGGGWENYFQFNLDFPFNHTLTRDDINNRLILSIADNSGKWFKNNGSDLWGTASNWTSDYITAGSQVPSSVEFGTFISAPQTVTIGGSQIANNIIFNSPNSYTVAGTGTLTLDSGGVSGVSVLQGNHTIQPTVRLLHDVQVSVAGSSNITFAGTIINANNAQLTKVGNGTATFTRLSMNTGSFTVNAGTATLTAKATANSPEGTSIVRNLSIATGAKLNLTNNTFIIDSTANPNAAALNAVRLELQDGRLFSSSTTASTALGYRTNVATASPTLLGMAAFTAGGDRPVGTFGGVAVDASSILIRLTLKGDTNLDGDVDIEDLYNLANNFLSTTATWLQGDFNYDGITNATDLSILAGNWQQTFSGGEILGGMSLDEALTSIGGLGNPSVPEPTTLAMAGVAAVGLLSRRRRRRV